MVGDPAFATLMASMKLEDDRKKWTEEKLAKQFPCKWVTFVKVDRKLLRKAVKTFIQESSPNLEEYKTPPSYTITKCKVGGGNDHCVKCHEGTPLPRHYLYKRQVFIHTKKSPYSYCPVKEEHPTYKLNTKKWSCSSCPTGNNLHHYDAFSQRQLKKKAHRRKCLSCSNAMLNLIESKITSIYKRLLAVSKQSVSEHISTIPHIGTVKHYTMMSQSEQSYILAYLITMTVEKEGPMYLVFKGDSISFLPKKGPWGMYKKILKTSDRVFLMPSDTCPTQIRLKKEVKKVGLSLQFLFIILAAKFKIKVSTFSKRRYSPGYDNSVRVDKEMCKGDQCKNEVLSCKALPYCPNCICNHFESLSQGKGMDPRPAYNKFNDNLLNWTKKILLSLMTLEEIRQTIFMILQTEFWKDCVIFSIKYEMEVQFSRRENLSQMCSICRGPCAVFASYVRSVGTCESISPPPFLGDSCRQYAEKDNGCYLREILEPVVIFDLSGFFDFRGTLVVNVDPSEFFDLRGNANRQISNAEEKMAELAVNLTRAEGI